ncbi:hypothetical protein GUITHDRAFT_108960 [Guillardia theta CCMP2712]|uniref:G-patch domain-containing protein n=1 Tax=Guillardia theta (strain CCMP2712) TaxID=905079 RepID=L1J9Y6_GUITC|nr:hypothetical protein GUITHDRAFT_108960 [Guillardia theta CCMP2712]EKX45321.1 hypothetical protein GUITHDRAFT_108960 [Guillardia theta CCMP2712]|eukprot:XP_005832301.1 hypothetical protein GUITHDRAFT_108960 [Guillardia theta CCMP2712]
MKDRDGLHIDIVDIARQMEEFRLRVLSEQGGDVEEEEGDAGEEHVEPARHAEVEGEQEAAELREEVSDSYRIAAMTCRKGALLEKYSKIERGAATKRIPTLQHPNEGGFASWEAHTTGFGSRMLMQMGLDMSEAAQQGRRATSLLNSSSRVGIGFGDSLREQE